MCAELLIVMLAQIVVCEKFHLPSVLDLLWFAELNNHSCDNCSLVHAVFMVYLNAAVLLNLVLVIPRSKYYARFKMLMDSRALCLQRNANYCQLSLVVNFVSGMFLDVELPHYKCAICKLSALCIVISYWQSSRSAQCGQAWATGWRSCKSLSQF